MSPVKLDALRFDTSDNKCQSLRILAEKVRSGDADVIGIEVNGPVISLKVATVAQGKRT